MKNKAVVIVTTETNLNFNYYNNEQFFLIGVERGCLDLIKKGIKIDLAIADFDHVLQEELDLIKVAAHKFMLLDAHKDVIDGLAAIQWTQEHTDPQEIIFIAKPTKRYDMNLSILDLMQQFDNLTIINDQSVIRKLLPGEHTLDFNSYQEMTYVSFFSLEDDNEIVLKDLVYPYRGKINVFSTRCISNSFIPYTNPMIQNNKPLIVILSR